LKYTKEVIFIEKLISNVLTSLNKNSLFQNEDFKIYQELHFEHWVKLSLNKSNSVSILFEISNNELRIDIDRTSETYTYDIEFIKENEEYIRNIITMIFTCSIKVEYCGENYTKLYFINKEGKTLNTFSFTTGLLGFFGLISKKNCKEKLYPPIYPSEKICLTEPVIPNK
jgi:pantothenate kinase